VSCDSPARLGLSSNKKPWRGGTQIPCFLYAGQVAAYSAPHTTRSGLAQAHCFYFAFSLRLLGLVLRSILFFPGFWFDFPFSAGFLVVFFILFICYLKNIFDLKIV
jgi:hypothetical protein